jgi:hypothetical protein
LLPLGAMVQTRRQNNTTQTRRLVGLGCCCNEADDMEL